MIVLQFPCHPNKQGPTRFQMILQVKSNQHLPYYCFVECVSLEIYNKIKVRGYTKWEWGQLSMALTFLSSFDSQSNGLF